MVEYVICIIFEGGLRLRFNVQRKPEMTIPNAK